MESNNTNLTPIQQFYSGSKIFITGGTGFLGTILVEKLLRSCLNIHKIYLLIRPKNGTSSDDRMTRYFNNIVFNQMKKENPNYINQVVGVHGDITKAKLGLSENDRSTLIEEVNIVFHLAATVNFNEKLHRSILINIKGTEEIITLSRQMKNLKFIIHTSTAYVHCMETVLEEKFHKSPYKANALLTIADNLSSEKIDELTNILLENFPNTYTFTKTIAEDLIESCNDLPIAIFRPAIIVSTLKEPLPGWVNNFAGATWATVGVMTGLIRSLNVDPNVGSNLVPVDMCTNTLIAIPWQCREKYEMAINSQLNYSIPIYNYESNSCQSLSWGNYREFINQYSNMYPPVNMIREPFVVMNKHYILHTINIIMLHYVPALLINGISRCIKKKSILFKQYKLIDKSATVSRYFGLREWSYKSNSLIELCDSMSQEDYQLFFCDLRKLDWNQYFKSCILGCRTYLLKDDTTTIAFAKKKLFCFKIATRSMLILMFYYLMSFCRIKLLYRILINGL